MSDPLMDPDQHRPKRSRLRSADGDNDIRREGDAGSESEQADEQPQVNLPTATIALQNLSFRDKQQTQNEANTGHTSCPPPNPTPPTSFLNHPFHANGTSKPNFSFRINGNHSSNHLTPPTSFVTTRPASHPHGQDPPNRNHSGEESNRSQSTIHPILPIHGSRPEQPSGGKIAGPSLQQIERDAQRPPPQQNHTIQNHKPPFSSFELRTTPLPRADGPFSSSKQPPITPVQNMARPVLVPTSQKDVGKPVGHTHTTTASRTTGQALLEAQREIANASKNHGITTSAVNSHTNAGRPLQCNLHAARNFPYPSIHPANFRRFNDDNLSLPPSAPPNHYTSPDRVSNAALIASRKRKRGWPTLPPPAYIYRRTDNPNFNIFGGILLYPELCFALAANLPVNDLISLYAISKDFHTIIDSRFATVIMSQSTRKCPESSQIFHWRCYKYLCRDDPAPRIPHPHPTKQAAGEIRKVPGFKWLKMVLFREKVCHEIMTLMAEDGVPLPRRCELALKRMWFVMDIPDNARRIGFMHANKFVSDLDLYFMMCFFIKLDMRFNDPVGPNRYLGLRKTLLSQRSLSPLYDTLKREGLPTKYNALKVWVATRYHPRPGDALPVFGVPANELGKVKMEYWGERATHNSGKPCDFLLRPDQLAMREIIRRKMVFSKHYLRCLLWGYTNIVTLDNYPPRKWNRIIEEMVDDYEEDECSDGVGVPSAAAGDNLLDLGVKKPISMLVERPKSNLSMEKRNDAFLEDCMKWCKNERRLTMDEMAD